MKSPYLKRNLTHAFVLNDLMNQLLVMKIDLKLTREICDIAGNSAKCAVEICCSVLQCCMLLLNSLTRRSTL